MNQEGQTNHLHHAKVLLSKQTQSGDTNVRQKRESVHSAQATSTAAASTRFYLARGSFISLVTLGKVVAWG